MAMRTAAANIHCKARMRAKSAQKAIDRAETVILSCFLMKPLAGVGMIRRGHMVTRFIVANPGWFCHKRQLHRPADQGCRGDVGCGLFQWETTEHFQRSNEHLAAKAPFGRV